MILSVFNPENDLALANGLASYVAPKAIRRMAQDLFLLPKVWIKTDKIIFFRENLNLKSSDITSCQVWGWSNQVRRRLIDAGIDEAILPTPVMLDKSRQWAHRRHTLQVLEYFHLSDYPYDLPTTPVCASTEQEVNDFIASHSRQWLLKQPWSSSGKGLLWPNQMSDSHREGWIRQTISRMGDLMCEKVYDKIFDMGMGFHIDDEGQSSSVGFSLFLTDKKGAYLGNCLLSDEDIIDFAAEYIPSQQLMQTRDMLLSFIKENLAEFHRGYLGVDLMVYKDDKGDYQLHPCVEINLRMTMGILARKYFDYNMQKGEQGVFSILASPNHKSLLEQIDSLKEQYNNLQMLSTPTIDANYAAVVYDIDDFKPMILSLDHKG